MHRLRRCLGLGCAVLGWVLSRGFMVFLRNPQQAVESGLEVRLQLSDVHVQVVMGMAPPSRPRASFKFIFPWAGGGRHLVRCPLALCPCALTYCFLCLLLMWADPGGLLGPWFQLGPALAMAGILGVSRPAGYTSVELVAVTGVWGAVGSRRLGSQLSQVGADMGVGEGSGEQVATPG